MTQDIIQKKHCTVILPKDEVYIPANGEIQFRAIAIPSANYNGYVYGYYVKCRGHHYILQSYNSSGYDERWEASEWVEINIKTLEQLHDNK